MVGVVNHGGYRRRNWNDPSRRRNAQQRIAAIRLHRSRFPQDRFIDHLAKDAFCKLARIDLSGADRPPGLSEFMDSVVEGKIRCWAGVPAFAEILFQMNWVQHRQSPALRVRRIQPPDNSVQDLKQSR